MHDFHFNISGKILIEGLNDELTIHPENIVNLIRVSDYQDKLTPMMLIRLNLDREFLDLIIRNVEAVKLHLRIGKFAKFSDEVRTLTDASYIEDDFSIILNNDFNYTKELDYASDKTDGVANRDKYKQIYFGLVSKASIDANKIMENCIIQDTTMQDLVLSYLTHTHLLVEPFEYNDKLSQLVIPPIDNLSSLIEFLASIKVFYSTRYLFFIDEPYCTYLISRSGNGVAMKGEEYNQVNIRLKGVQDVDGLTIGMSTDITNQAYSFDVSVLDSKYIIDHDTAKIINQIETIVNPSNDNNQEKNANMKQTKYQIEKMKDDYIERLGGYSKTLGNFEQKFGCLTTSIIGNVADTMPNLLEFQNKVVDTATDQLFSLAEEAMVEVSPYLTIAFQLLKSSLKKGFQNVANKCLSTATSALTKAIDKIPGPISSMTKNVVPESYEMDYSDNEIACLTYVNLQENIASTISNANLRPSGISEVFSDLPSLQSLANDNTGKFVSEISNVFKKAGGGMEVIKNVTKIFNQPYFDLFTDQFPDLENTLQNISDNVDKMEQCMNEAEDSFSKLKGDFSKYNDNARIYKNVASGIAGMSGLLASVQNFDIKSTFVSNNISTKSFSNNTNNTIKKTANFLNKASAFMNIGAGILSAGTITFNDILNIKDNLKSYNIDKIGHLGLSSFESSLNILNDVTSKRGTKIVKVRNDNPNEIKNVKSDLETMVNQLTVNKFGLDPSVFTPNKKYVVLNYDGHNDKNGLFILNHKIETYIREDETFVCNTRLDLAKVPDNVDTTKARATSF